MKNKMSCLCIGLLLSCMQVQSAVVQHFTYEGHNMEWVSNNWHDRTGSFYYGEATLYDNGVLDMWGTLEVKVDNGDKGIIAFETKTISQLKGTLDGIKLMDISLASHSLVSNSCSDNGSTIDYLNICDSHEAIKNDMNQIIWGRKKPNFGGDGLNGDEYHVILSGMALSQSITLEGYNYPDITMALAFTPVPLPASSWLFLAALSGLAWIKNQPKSRHAC